MADANPQASRKIQSRGAATGKVLWNWSGFSGWDWMHEPRVAGDGNILVRGLDGQLVFLSQKGEVVRTIPATEGGWRDPVLATDGTLYAAGGRHLTAFSASGETAWQTKVEGILHLRGTPGGELFSFSREGFGSIGTDGKRKWAVQEGESAWSEGLCAFDQEGNLYTAEKDHWRGSPDDEAENFSRIGAYDARGKKSWARNLTAPCATDDPENTVDRIWGLADSAVFFGSPRIQAYSKAGKLLWEICRRDDFRSLVELKGYKFRLGWDPRLAQAPCLRMFEHWQSYTDCAVDGEGNIYFCHDQQAISLDPDFRLRWQAEFPAVLFHPVIGPPGTLLVNSSETLYVLG